MKPEEVEVIVAKANDNHSRIEAAKVPLPRMTLSGAFGTTQDCRAGLSVIKGHEQLLLLAEGTRPPSIKLDAIPCIEAEQAESLRLMLGDCRAEHQTS